MTEAVERPDVPPAKARDWVEILSTVLLALAAVATAWSSYQATRWHGEQAKTTSTVNATRISAARAAGLAENETQVDVALFIQWIDAQATGDAPLATFYVERFRPEFRPAFDAWMATDPFTSTDAPLSPFAMPEYQLDETAEAEELDERAEMLAADVRAYIELASNYVLGVVLFSVSLFFAGISTQVATPRLRKATVAVGCILFAGTVAWIATFPVSVGI